MRVIHLLEMNKIIDAAAVFKQIEWRNILSKNDAKHGGKFTILKPTYPVVNPVHKILDLNNKISMQHWIYYDRTQMVPDRDRIKHITKVQMNLRRSQKGVILLLPDSVL